MVGFLRSDRVQEYATALGSYIMWMQWNCLLCLFFLWNFPHHMTPSLLWNSMNQWSFFRLQRLAAEMDEMSTNVEVWAPIRMSKLAFPLRSRRMCQGYHVSQYVSICWLFPHMYFQGWKAIADKANPFDPKAMGAEMSPVKDHSSMSRLNQMTLFYVLVVSEPLQFCCSGGRWWKFTIGREALRRTLVLKLYNLDLLTL